VLSLECYTVSCCIGCIRISIERSDALGLESAWTVVRAPWTAPAQEKRGKFYFRLYRHVSPFRSHSGELGLKVSRKSGGVQLHSTDGAEQSCETSTRFGHFRSQEVFNS